MPTPYLMKNTLLEFLIFFLFFFIYICIPLWQDFLGNGLFLTLRTVLKAKPGNHLLRCYRAPPLNIGYITLLSEAFRNTFYCSGQFYSTTFFFSLFLSLQLLVTWLRLGYSFEPGPNSHAPGTVELLWPSVYLYARTRKTSLPIDSKID